MMSELKEELRNDLKNARLSMSRDEVEKFSRVITKKIIENTDWQKVKSLHIYSPIPSLNEVDTLPLIKYVQENWPQIDIAIEAQSEPKLLPTLQFDLVVVPTLGFDKTNNRLGWGGGFYDKLLAAQPKALKVGLCFDIGLVENGIPPESHDIRLDQIVTEVN
jgi:5-formyltetrahydrofolate cyclo-ligase